MAYYVTPGRAYRVKVYDSAIYVTNSYAGFIILELYGLAIEEITNLSDKNRLLFLAPNPTNGRLTISYIVPEDSPSYIRIYNISGRLVRTLVSGIHEVGHYKTTWQGEDSRGKLLPSGVYFVRMEAEEFNSTRKVVLVR